MEEARHWRKKAPEHQLRQMLYFCMRNLFLTQIIRQKPSNPLTNTEFFLTMPSHIEERGAAPSPLRLESSFHKDSYAALGRDTSIVISRFNVSATARTNSSPQAWQKSA